MQCVVVAAGIGTRLYPLSEIIPKVMLPVGRKQLPVGHHIINHCMDHDIEEFIFCLNKRQGRQAINYFGSGGRFGVDIVYSLSEKPLGTAGEMKVAWGQGLIEPPSLIYYGDTLCSTDLDNFILLHIQNGGDVSIVVNDNIRIPTGYVEDIEGVVLRIVEKPRLIDIMKEKSSGGVLPIFYVTNEDFYTIFCGVNKDIMNDVMPEMLRTQYNVLAYHDDQPFIDMGDFKSYRLANQEW